jgi:hypothetical protein
VAVCFGLPCDPTDLDQPSHKSSRALVRNGSNFNCVDVLDVGSMIRGSI